MVLSPSMAEMSRYTYHSARPCLRATATVCVRHALSGSGVDEHRLLTGESGYPQRWKWKERDTVRAAALQHNVCRARPTQ